MRSSQPFGALLRDRRRLAHLTQEELAVRARVGVRTLRDLETGRASRPQRSTVDLLAAALQLVGAEREEFFAAARRPAAARAKASPARLLRAAPPLIGRDDAVRGLGSLLEVVDLITLVGLSGVGKTSLALTVGHHVADRFGGGVGGVTVTSASTESEVLASVAAALHVTRVDDLAVRLAGPPALIVLIGADRSPGAARGALHTLRRPGSNLRVLVTSTHPLRLPGEHQWPVLPLDVPRPDATTAEIFAAPATQLFLDRLRLVRSRPVAAHEALALGSLVRRLGGVPLALELAAARGRVLEIDEMLARTADAHPTDPAGQSLREAVLASWRLLTPVEQECLCWLAVFQWRWSVELAEQVLAPLPGPDIVALIDRLVGLGLVSVRPGPHDLRFWLLDAVRSVALEQADRAGTLGAARDGHAQVIATAAARAVADLAGPQAAPARARLDRLAADIEAAVEHLQGRDPEAAKLLAADLAEWQRLRGL